MIGSRPVRRIAILLHERHVDAEKTRYIIWSLRDIWRARGVEVVTVHGTAVVPDADLLIPHLDVTVVPKEYARVVDAHPRALNRAVRDVSKRAFSRQLVRPGDGYEGAVIVKTDRNSGGWSDRHLVGRPRPRRLTRLLHRLSGRYHALAHAGNLDSHDYPVFPSVREVPREVFDNPALVVERFVPERRDGQYCLRNYTFCGTRHVCGLQRYPDPVVKSTRGSKREDVDVPDSIVAARERLGLDYGKLDFVLHEGEPVLIDVNPTPIYGRPKPDAAERARSEWLAGGIFP